MELGERLKEARQNAGLKQEELAKQLGVSRQTISNWENGRSLPDVGSAVKLSGVYNVSLDELLKDEGSVLKTFEDLAAKRRKFWQMMLEIGIILDMLSSLLVVQQLEGIAIFFRIAGIALEYLSIFMHLKVFDHDWGRFSGALSDWFCTWDATCFCGLPCRLWASIFSGSWLCC